MLVTVSQYRALPQDGNGNILVMAGDFIASEARTTDGAFTALSDECRFIRIATDTKIHIDFAGSVSNQDPMMPANTAELWAAPESRVVNILTGV